MYVVGGDMCDTGGSGAGGAAGRGVAKLRGTRHTPPREGKGNPRLRKGVGRMVIPAVG